MAIFAKVRMKRSKRISCLMMIVLLLLSSNGFAVHEHFCSTANKYSFSLMTSESCKHDVEQRKTCCRSKTVSSCSYEVASKDIAEDEDCCNDEMRFTKLEQQYLTSQSLKFDKIDSFPFTAIRTIIWSDFVQAKEDGLFVSDKSPPLLMSMHSASFLQCFRC